MATQPTGMWTIRLAAGSDAEAIATIHDRTWGKTVAGHGVLYHLSNLPALVCVDRSERVVGVLTIECPRPGYRVAIDAGKAQPASLISPRSKRSGPTASNSATS